jgi:hypothetical protein
MNLLGLVAVRTRLQVRDRNREVSATITLPGV